MNKVLSKTSERLGVGERLSQLQCISAIIKLPIFILPMGFINETIYTGGKLAEVIEERHSFAGFKYYGLLSLPILNPFLSAQKDN